MLTVYFTSDSRYKVNRLSAKKYLASIWQERGLPDGIISLVFVGSRKGRILAKEYLKDDQAHPVITFPLLTKERSFAAGDKRVLGEIVICYPQVTLYAAEQDKEIDTVVRQFIDHAVNILGVELRKIVLE